MKVLHTFIALVCIGLLCAVNVKAQPPNITFAPVSGTTLTWERVNQLLNIQFPGLGLSTGGTYSALDRIDKSIPEFTATIPDGITLGDYAVRDFLTSLVGITFSGNVGNIGFMAVNGNTMITSVIFNGDVGNIGSLAFFGCPQLTSVTFNGDVGNIDRQAFQNTGLTSITIPASVTSIGWRAFSNCPLVTVTFLRAIAPTIDDNAFDISLPGVDGIDYFSNTILAAINIPAGSLASYTDAINAETHVTDLVSLLVEVSGPKPPRPPRKPGDVRIGGSVNIGKGSTLNIGKP